MLFVPAPFDLDEPAYGFGRHDIPLYPPEEIAGAVLSAEAMTRPRGSRRVGRLEGVMEGA
jgi:hypothetical protein